MARSSKKRPKKRKRKRPMTAKEIGSTPRASEIRDRRRKALGLSKGGKGGATKVKAHTRKGKRVAEHQRKINQKGGGASSGPKIPKAKVATAGRKIKVAKGVSSPLEAQAVRAKVKTTARRRPDAALAAEGSRYAKKATGKPGKTKSHTKAGLHRVGKKGNTYLDAKGDVYQRGKGGTFKRGKGDKKALGKVRTRQHDAAAKAWNAQPDAQRMARRGNLKGKVPKGYMVHEDASVGPDRKTLVARAKKAAAKPKARVRTVKTSQRKRRR